MTTNGKGDLERDDEGAKALGKIITELEDGAFHADSTRELMALNRTLREHAKIRGKAKGEMHITLKFECDEYEVISVNSSFKVKTPVAPRKRSIFWLTPGGNLSPTNPKQIELPIRAVPAPNRAEDAPAPRRKDAP